MSLEKSSIQWSAKQIKGMVVNGKISFKNIVQRSYVWERSRKTGLIESMIIGFPVPVIYAKRSEDNENTNGRSNKCYDVLDGKQRLSTIKEFLNDEFELTEIPSVKYYDEEMDCECETNISGMKFSELPDAIKDHLASVTFTVTYFDNLTKEEERELFKRLNAGKPLSTKSRLLASCKDIEGMLDIGSHKLFEEMLSDKARDNKNQVTIVMKSYCMLNQNINDVSFASKDFNPLVEETKISETEKLEMIEVFNLMYDVHSNLIERKEKKVAKKLYTETHMVSLVPFFKRAVENGIDENLMADWLVSFFGVDSGASVSDGYNEACGSGSAKSVNIIARNDALVDSYESFFKNEEVVEEVLQDAEDIEGDYDYFYDEDREPTDEELNSISDSEFDDSNNVRSYVDSLLDEMDDTREERYEKFDYVS